MDALIRGLDYYDLQGLAPVQRQDLRKELHQVKNGSTEPRAEMAS